MLTSLEPTTSKISFGIESLDRHMADLLQPKKQILVAGASGSGKTILAGQLAGHTALAGNTVLFLSTEVEHPELECRIISNFCALEYSAIRDGIDIDHDGFPNRNRYPLEFANRYSGVMAKLRTKLHICDVYSITTAPKRVFESILCKLMARRSDVPGLVILDYLREPNDVDPRKTDTSMLRQIMSEAMDALHEIANIASCATVAFCQATPLCTGVKEVGPEMIADYKHLADEADGFVGISQMYSEGGESTTYSTEQYLTVKQGTSETSVIPVFANFDFQRFEDRIEPSDAGKIENRNCRDESVQGSRPGGSSGCKLITSTSALAHRDTNRNEIRSAILNMEYQGYVCFPRDVICNLCDHGNLNCINLYAFLMLTANWGKGAVKPGCSFWGRDSIASILGLSVKQIRVATKRLDDISLISVNGSRGASLSYEVLDWEESQDPHRARNYFKLFRCLRDSSRHELFGNPQLFRLWLYFLACTRATDDDVLAIPAGSFLLRPSQIGEHLKLSAEALSSLLGVLSSTGRIELDDKIVRIVNWHLYQKMIYSKDDQDGVEKHPSQRGEGQT